MTPYSRLTALAIKECFLVPLPKGDLGGSGLCDDRSAIMLLDLGHRTIGLRVEPNHDNKVLCHVKDNDVCGIMLKKPFSLRSLAFHAGYVQSHHHSP